MWNSKGFTLSLSFAIKAFFFHLINNFTMTIHREHSQQKEWKACLASLDFYGIWHLGVWGLTLALSD